MSTVEEYMEYGWHYEEERGCDIAMGSNLSKDAAPCAYIRWAGRARGHALIPTSAGQFLLQLRFSATDMDIVEGCICVTSPRSARGQQPAPRGRQNATAPKRQGLNQAKTSFDLSLLTRQTLIRPIYD